MHRLFVAIRPPEPICDLLIDAMDDTAHFRWQNEEQLHITLRFIGEVDRPVAEDLAASLERIHFAAIRPPHQGAGRFEQRNGGALWAGVEPREPVAALAAKVERICQSVGLEPERRAFHPHITLARWKGRRCREVAASSSTARPRVRSIRRGRLHPFRKPLCRGTARITRKWRATPSPELAAAKHIWPQAAAMPVTSSIE